MKQVNIHEAKTHLSRLVAEASEGRPFVIARAGHPLVEVRAVTRRDDVARRIGFLVPGGRRSTAPIKDVGAEEIVAMFDGDADGG